MSDSELLCLRKRIQILEDANGLLKDMLSLQDNWLVRLRNDVLDVIVTNHDVVSSATLRMMVDNIFKLYDVYDEIPGPKIEDGGSSNG